MREIAKKLKISYSTVYYSLHRAVHYPFTEQCKLAITRIERVVGGPGAQLSKRTSTLECLGIGAKKKPSKKARNSA